MKELIYSIGQFTGQSKLIIALAAVTLSLATEVQLGIAQGLRPFHLLIFCAAFTEYNLHRFTKYYTLSRTDRDESYKWVSGNLPFIWIITCISLLVLLISFFSITKGSKWIFLATALLTLLYSISPYGRYGYISLRNIPFLKTFLVALVWTVITVMIPAVEGYERMTFGTIPWIITGRFLLILALALLFDFRDITPDKVAGIKTIPMALGQKLTFRLVLILLILFVASALFQSIEKDIYYPFIAAASVTFVILLLINIRNAIPGPLFYPVFLDGSLVLYSLMMIIGWFIFA